MDKKDKQQKAKKINEKKMSFVDHLEELRWVIVKSLAIIIVFSITSFMFSEKLVEILTAPYPEAKLIALSPMEPFTVRLNLSVFMGIILSLPVIIYQFWSFVAPGLLKKEKKFVPWIIFLTILCFLTGAIFCYYIIIPNALRFFAKFQVGKLVMQTSIDRYLSFVTRLLVVFGLAFELPIVSALLAKMGILTPGIMKSARGYAIVIIFSASAILTPPDVISQIYLAIPIIILYEISIWITKIFAKKREEELEEALGDEDEYEVIEKEKGHKKLIYGLLTVVGLIIIIPAFVILFKIQLPFIETQLSEILPVSLKTAYSIIGLTVIAYFFAAYKVVKFQREKIVTRIKKLKKKIRKAIPEKIKEKEKKDKKAEEKEVEKKTEQVEALTAKKDDKIEVYDDEDYEYDDYDDYDYEPEEPVKPAVSKIDRQRKILRWTGVIIRRPRKIWWNERVVWWKGRMIRKK